jgi:hypothetical protein
MIKDVCIPNMERRRIQLFDGSSNQDEASTSQTHEHLSETSEQRRERHTRLLRSHADSASSSSHSHPMDASGQGQSSHQPHVHDGLPSTSGSTELHEPSESRMDRRPQLELHEPQQWGQEIYRLKHKLQERGLNMHYLRCDHQKQETDREIGGLKQYFDKYKQNLQHIIQKTEDFIEPIQKPLNHPDHNFPQNYQLHDHQDCIDINQELDQQIQDINQLRQALNQQIQDINQLGNGINQQIQDFDQKMQNINQYIQTVERYKHFFNQSWNELDQRKQYLYQQKDDLKQWEEIGKDIYQWNQDMYQLDHHQKWLDRLMLFHQEQHDLEQQHDFQQRSLKQQYFDLYKCYEDIYYHLQFLDIIQQHDNFDDIPDPAKKLLISNCNSIDNNQKWQEYHQTMLPSDQQKVSREMENLLKQLPFHDIFTRQQLEKSELLQRQWSSEWHILHDHWQQQDREHIEQDRKLLRKLLQHPPQKPDEQLKLIRNFQKQMDIRRSQMKMRMLEYLSMDHMLDLREQQINEIQQHNDHFHQHIQDFDQQHSEFKEEFCEFYEQIRTFYEQREYIEHAMRKSEPESYQQVLHHIEQILDTDRDELNHIGQHLEIDLSRETMGTWGNFVNDVLDKYMRNGLNRSALILSDVSYNDNKYVTKAEREDGTYERMKTEVRNQWHAWLKKRNHDHEPQNPTEANLS